MSTLHGRYAAQHLAFLDAYCGARAGNATHAAIDAGYSPATAAQTASRLLRLPAIQRELERRLKRDSLSIEECLEHVSAIAKAPLPAKVQAKDILAANALILKAKGALQGERSAPAFQVSIGFFAGAQAPALQALQGVSPAHANSQPKRIGARPGSTPGRVRIGADEPCGVPDAG